MEAALKLRTAQLQALADAALKIARAPDLSATLAVVTAEARSIIGAHQSVVSLTSGPDWSQAINSVDLTDKYAQWRDYAAAPDGAGIYSWVCAENRPVRMTQAELEAHPRWKGFGRHASDHPPMRGWLAAPLVARDGRNLGLVQLSDKADGGEFDEADEALLVQLAQLASAAFEQAVAEEALRSSEARFRAAMDAVDGVLWTNDAEGRMTGEQPGWSRLTGQSRAEYEGFGWSAAVHPDDAQPTIDAWLRAVEQREPFIFEHRLKRAAGDWRLFAIRAIPVFDASGAIREWVGVHTDVTDLRSQERALQEERDRVWTYFEQAPSFMAVVRGKDHVFELVNQAYRQIVGHRELIGRTLREAFPKRRDRAWTVSSSSTSTIASSPRASPTSGGG